MKPFERLEEGWGPVDISVPAQGNIERAFHSLGIDIEVFDLADWRAAFDAWRHLGEYEGEYRMYAGAQAHCFLEKALEHFISIMLAKPVPKATAVDVGSCKSVLPTIIRRVYGVNCYEQDLVYSPGIDEQRIGSSADAIPLPDQSVDFMTLHCTFEHFEGHADSGFVRECGRLLRKGGRAVILPLYLSEFHCNVTGEADAGIQASIGWDLEAEHYRKLSDWQNRFGRHYSPQALLHRVLEPANAVGLRPRLFKVVGWESVDPSLWLRWVLVLER